MKNKNFNFDEEFASLILDNKLNINTIEDLAVSSINEYKQFIHQHIEKLSLLWIICKNVAILGIVIIFIENIIKVLLKGKAILKSDLSIN